MEVFQSVIDKIAIGDNVIMEEESPYIKYCLVKYKCWLIFILSATLCFTIFTAILATVIQSESFSKIAMYIMKTQQESISSSVFKNVDMHNFTT
jgi:hypothetical protein